MNVAVFKDKVRHAGYLPQALAHYLVSIADTLKPDVRERIAGKIDAGTSKLLAAAKRAAEDLDKLERKAKK